MPQCCESGTLPQPERKAGVLSRKHANAPTPTFSFPLVGPRSHAASPICRSHPLPVKALPFPPRSSLALFPLLLVALLPSLSLTPFSLALPFLLKQEVPVTLCEAFFAYNTGCVWVRSVMMREHSGTSSIERVTVKTEQNKGGSNSRNTQGNTHVGFSPPPPHFPLTRFLLIVEARCEGSSFFFVNFSCFFHLDFRGPSFTHLGLGFFFLFLFFF